MVRASLLSEPLAKMQKTNDAGFGSEAQVASPEKEEKMRLRVEEFVKCGHGQTNSSPPPSNNEALNARTFDEKSSYAFCDKGELGKYYVVKPQIEDVACLRAIEREFVRDHWQLFKGEAMAGWESILDWCEAVNVIGDEKDANSAIVSIVKGQTARHFTLECVYVPAEEDIASDREIVGYVHFVDCVGHIDASHLKVASGHQRRGIGSLLLSGMAALVKEGTVNCKAKGKRDIRLVVMSRNEPAIQLYKTLGFEVIGSTANFLGKSGSKIDWTRMARRCKDNVSAEKALGDFIQTCAQKTNDELLVLPERK